LRVLLVKLSSLGDVVHTLPVVQDIRRALPSTQIDWVIETGFAPLLNRCAGIDRVIAFNLRRWRNAPLKAVTRLEWKTFNNELHHEPYDAVIDLQGLSKSAWVAWMARLAPGAKRFAMANRTEGSGYEFPTRWVADVALPMPWHVHAVHRGRELCARALGYELSSEERYGLEPAGSALGATKRPCVALVHGTSRPDKQWPDSHWIELARLLDNAGFDVAFPHGSDAEEKSSRTFEAVLPNARAWARLQLDALIDAMADCAGVIGVDSGLSHIAVALDLPHVQIYNIDTAWRTGPLGRAHQQSVFASPAPSVEMVWQAWLEVAKS